MVVVFKVKPSNLQEPSFWSKAAYWGLELFLSKGVQNKIHPFAICLWHYELLKSGVSRVANVVVSQLKQTKINYHFGIPTLVEYLGVVIVQSCAVRTVFVSCNAFLYIYNQSDVLQILQKVSTFCFSVLMWSTCYYKWVLLVLKCIKWTHV